MKCFVIARLGLGMQWPKQEPEQKYDGDFPLEPSRELIATVQVSDFGLSRIHIGERTVATQTYGTVRQSCNFSSVMAVSEVLQEAVQYAGRVIAMCEVAD